MPSEIWKPLETTARWNEQIAQQQQDLDRLRAFNEWADTSAFHQYELLRDELYQRIDLYYENVEPTRAIPSQVRETD